LTLTSHLPAPTVTDTARFGSGQSVLRLEDHALLTGAELAAAGTKPIPGSTFKRADGLACAAPVRRALAHERVRFVGEAVAAVVADTLQQARDAAEAVRVDYTELPMVVNLNDAIAPAAPVLDEAAPDNIAGQTRYGNAQDTNALRRAQFGL
jgi:carbon-monoxide dehydrogenase large subunit